MIAQGHNAISADILPTLSPGPHYQGEVFDIVNEPWDAAIFFHPCTYLAFVGMRWNVNNPQRQAQTQEAANTVVKLLDLPIPRIALENPVGVIPRMTGRKWSQIIHPYQFGHPVKKPTCLWLKNLPLLTPTNVVDYRADMKETTGGKTISRWFSNNKAERDITFDGIADAMGKQWGPII